MMKISKRSEVFWPVGNWRPRRVPQIWQSRQLQTSYHSCIWYIHLHISTCICRRHIVDMHAKQDSCYVLWFAIGMFSPTCVWICAGLGACIVDHLQFTQQCFHTLSQLPLLVNPAKPCDQYSQANAWLNSCGKAMQLQVTTYNNLI